MKKSFYITTAIVYASVKPHIGNTYEIVAADAIARYKRLFGYDVYFQTGTDEHGKKIQLKAKEVDKNPQIYVDEISAEVKKIWDIMNISYDVFVRTTDSIHKEKVQQIFKKLYDQGDIYKGKYEGLYCTPCESFFTEFQLIDGKCPDCGRPVEKVSEEAYFLKLDKYTDRLIKHIEENPDFIQPESKKKEIINNFIKPGLQDLCVSRTSFNWGIPITFDDNHVIYVWIDALSNYITFLGYDINGNHTNKYCKYWPADLHLVGKDILRFHVIYWPIILMALGEELPKKTLAHPWFLMGGDKMSKSKGNILYADDLVELFGVDAIRYYVLKEMPFVNDGIITYDLIIDRFNSDLANLLGNLINRIISMNEKYFYGEVQLPLSLEKIDNDLISLVLKTPKLVEKAMNELKISDALNYIIDLVRKSHKYIDETTPWSLANDDIKKKRLGTILYNLLETARFIAVLLQPFMPETAKNIFEQLNVKNTNLESLKKFNGLVVGSKCNKPKPLFMRIDKIKKIKEIKKLNLML